MDFYHGSSNIARRKIRIQEDQNQTPKEGEKYIFLYLEKLYFLFGGLKDFSGA